MKDNVLLEKLLKVNRLIMVLLIAILIVLSIGVSKLLAKYDDNRIIKIPYNEEENVVFFDIFLMIIVIIVLIIIIKIEEFDTGYELEQIPVNGGV